MRIKKKYLGKLSGFIRFERFEINYHLTDWSLPFGFEYHPYLLFFRFLCVSLIINKK